MTVSYASEDVKIIKIGISHYPPYTDKSKKDLGMYPKYLKEILLKEGFVPVFVLLPYARSIQSLKEGSVDFAVLGTRTFIGKKNPFVLTDPFYYLRICVFQNFLKKN